ncbi:pentapeptide repeat-containing protein [Fluoribacter gormanii]|uniref:pentapeptide repeat-containing protein n=1 Tax=Fluoribacter gormanii TaxID=464 RepID=UPI003908971D
MDGGNFSYSEFNDAILKKAVLSRINFMGSDFSRADVLKLYCSMAIFLVGIVY